MAARFDPFTALEGSFLGFPFRIARERGEFGRRGPVHEYPDRDVPYFEDLGKKANRWELALYFVGNTADLQHRAFDRALQKRSAGPLILPGLRRETVQALTWSHDKESSRGNWVAMNVVFVEAGQNRYPASQTSWPHALLAAVTDAETAITDALGGALSLVDAGGLLSQEVGEGLIGNALGLGMVLSTVAQVAGGQAPASALAAAGLLVAAYTGGLGLATLDVVGLAVSTVGLLNDWSAALAGPAPDRIARGRAIDGLFSVYDEAQSDAWYAPAALTPLQARAVANQAAFSQGIRRAALAGIARQAASLDFVSYDDAAALRGRLADAFDDEIHFSQVPDGAKAALQALRSATLQAITAAGADKAKLVPYIVPRPRPSLALAQLFYGDDGDVPGRAAELAARTGAVHPAFMPARGERLSK